MLRHIYTTHEVLSQDTLLCVWYPVRYSADWEDRYSFVVTYSVFVAATATDAADIGKINNKHKIFTPISVVNEVGVSSILTFLFKQNIRWISRERYVIEGNRVHNQV